MNSPELANWTGQRVLITGAAGFVGSALARRLVASGAHVTAIIRDQASDGSLKAPVQIPIANIVVGSIADYSFVERVFNEHDVETCFHLAAQAMVGAANRSPLSTFESNIKGTWNVLEACRMIGTVRRVVIASSDKAYGTQPKLPYLEEMPLLGRNPYDVSKACADLLAQCYASSYDVPVVIARCANIYGPGDVNFSRLVPGTIRSVLQNESPIVRSDGSPLRDYLYIDDAVDAYLRLAAKIEQGALIGQAFNFGSGLPLKALELVELVLSVCERKDLQPTILGQGKPKLEIDAQYLDSGRARRDLGWAPAVSIQDGIARAVEWYRGHLGLAAAD